MSSCRVSAAAIRAAKDFKLGAGKRVVIVLADSVRNYMTKFLSDEWMVENGFMDSPAEARNKPAEPAVQATAQYGDATVRSLNLPDAITVRSTTTCSEAVDILNRGGFDQVPVVDDAGRMIGLVTIGNLLSRIASKRASSKGPVTEAMFHFNTKRKFEEITLDTKLDDLHNFFEFNSSAFVTETVDGVSRVTKVVTKVDLLQYLIHKAE